MVTFFSDHWFRPYEPKNQLTARNRRPSWFFELLSLKSEQKSKQMLFPHQLVYLHQKR